MSFIIINNVIRLSFEQKVRGKDIRDVKRYNNKKREQKCMSNHIREQGKNCTLKKIKKKTF